MFVKGEDFPYFHLPGKTSSEITQETIPGARKNKKNLKIFLCG
jgi:hypothetical protein